MRQERKLNHKKEKIETIITEDRELDKLQVEEAMQDISMALRNLQIRFPNLRTAFQKWKIKMTTVPIILSTDCEYLLCNPSFFLEANLSQKMIQKIIFHITLHGILGHFTKSVTPQTQELLWFLMDRQVEKLSQLMWDQPNGFPSALESRKQEILTQMEDLTGGKYDIDIYYALVSNKQFTKRWKVWAKYLNEDNHSLWYDLHAESSLVKLSAKSWEKLGKQLIQASALSKGGKGIGNENGKLVWNVKPANHEKLPYDRLLKDWIRKVEINREDSENFDTMLYQYGLSLYEDVPLIEPADYVQTHKEATICIAVDTSGSCSFDIANHFLLETENLLEYFGNQEGQIDILYLQCDMDIQKELYFPNLEQMRQSQKEMSHLCGGGGTSFEPVFEKIADFEKENGKIDLLIYLTDGMGDYPEERPEYPVLFVLPENPYEQELEQYVPGWIQTCSFRIS